MELYKDEASFVRALQAREARAAEALLREYGGLFKSIALRWAPGLDWEDIVADTVLAIWQNADRFDPAGSFRAWAGAVARYRAIDAVRAAARETPAGQNTELEALGAAGPDEYSAPNWKTCSGAYPRRTEIFFWNAIFTAIPPPAGKAAQPERERPEHPGEPGQKAAGRIEERRRPP